MANATAAPAPTIADRIAAALGDDGTIWRTADGVTLDQILLAEQADGFVDRHPRKPDVCRWTFPDGSVLTAAGDAWDLGFPTCWCWQGAPGDWHPAPNGACDRDPRDRAMPRPHPFLSPLVRSVVAGLLQDARAGYRLARQFPAYAAVLTEEANRFRSEARAIRGGDPFRINRYGWPYLVTTPVQGLTTTLED